jgi:hypothetical protein
MANVSATAMPGVGPDTKRAGQEAAEAGHTGETPVFAAPDGRRGRRLRTAALVLSVLVTLWLAGLVAGLLGFDALPALQVPDAPATGTDDVSPRASALPVSAHARRALQGGPAASTTTGSAINRRASALGSPGRRTGTQRTASTTDPTPTSHAVTPAPTATPQSPATTSAPAAPRGRRVGQTTTGTGNQTTKATPPGQAKEVKGPAAPAVANGRPADAGPKPKS